MTGERQVRNPAFTTAKEAQASLVTLGRRLKIDAASAEWRQRRLTRSAQALGAIEVDQISGDDDSLFVRDPETGKIDDTATYQRDLAAEGCMFNFLLCPCERCVREFQRNATSPSWRDQSKDAIAERLNRYAELRTYWAQYAKDNAIRLDTR